MLIHWAGKKSACWPVIHLNVTMMCGPSQITRWTRSRLYRSFNYHHGGQIRHYQTRAHGKTRQSNSRKPKSHCQLRDTYCANDKPDVVKRLFFNFLERVAECLKAMHLQMNCSGNCIEGYPVSTPGCCARIALRANLSQGKGTTTWLNHAPQ